MSQRRRFVVLSEFFDRLDELLPSERTASGTPSATDFLLHDLSTIVEALARDYESTTIPIPDSDERMLICAGTTVAYIAVSVRLSAHDTVEVVDVDLDFG